ncbi:hypothetical protein EWM64_g1349 [Hericium alpestre]|uniref:Uncharacterized protein n=1 Tax=Hericium alpestre TaxID=135208 RepID=A0A4Z0A6I0_9AGAM|nr:hypothetical protein EWM64_g1349 [Hericium alpestre]
MHCRNIKEFFDEPMEKTGDDGKVRKCRSCKPCQCKKVPQFLVNEMSTLCHHLEAKHAGEYQTWVVEDNFESKLPGDVKDQKVKDAQLSQTQLDSHLQKMPPAEHVVPYSDKVFHEAAIEWLIVTDQPISALEHLDFIKMINIAAQATNGMKTPVHDEIIRLFKNQIDLLRQKLLSDTVKGNINLTC